MIHNCTCFSLCRVPKTELQKKEHTHSNKFPSSRYGPGTAAFHHATPTLKLKKQHQTKKTKPIHSYPVKFYFSPTKTTDAYNIIRSTVRMRDMARFGEMAPVGEKHAERRCTREKKKSTNGKKERVCASRTRFSYHILADPSKSVNQHSTSSNFFCHIVVVGSVEEY